MKTSEIPGYMSARRRADRLEDHWRDYAFLGLSEELRFAGGDRVEARQLTLRMFVQLCAAHSPFLVGGRVGPEHVAQILWRLSPGYDFRMSDGSSRKAFVSSIAQIPFRSAVRTISRFLDKMLIDKPPISVKATDTKSDTCFAAAIIHSLASTYGWSDEAILDLPIPRIFQYLRQIQRDSDYDMIRFNPLRDKLTNRVTAKFFEERKRKREQNNGSNGQS